MGGACGNAFVCGSGSKGRAGESYLVLGEQRNLAQLPTSSAKEQPTQSEVLSPDTNNTEADKQEAITTNDDAYFKPDQLQLLKVKYSLGRQKQAKAEQKDNVPVNGKILWTEGTHLGSGSFGQVVMGMDKASGTLMAVKKVPIASLPTRGAGLGKTEALKQEIEIYNGLCHENIVRYFGSETTKDSFNIFLEYIEGKSAA